MIRLAVRVPSEAAEIVLAELLELAPHGVEEVPLGSGLVEYAVYGAPGELPSLPDLTALGGETLVEVSTSELPDGWEDRWREFHQPVTVSLPPLAEGGPPPPSIRIRPPWEEPGGRADAGEVEIEIDPGRAFGTGAHATTQLCLELLLEHLAGGSPRGALIDVGTGSGVIAIAAAKLGFSPILALDCDPASIEQAMANARANGVAIDVRQFDLRREPLPHPGLRRASDGLVLCANLLLPLLLELASSLARPPAHLIAGGLLRVETDVAAGAFAERLGMVEHSRRVRGEWAGLTLSAPSQPPSGSSVAARTIAR